MKLLEINGVKISWLRHASVLIEWDEKTLFIDPYEINVEKKADIILITHEHFDHCDLESIEKVSKEGTIVIAPKDCLEKIPESIKKIEIKPGEIKEINGLKIEAVPAYNIKRFRAPNQPFHPKENNWVGYIIEINGIRIYHAGDTDFVDEMKELKNLDVALVPIGGTFTMDVEEAAEFVNEVKPKYVVPIHYNTWPNIQANPAKLKELVKESEVVILERLL